MSGRRIALFLALLALLCLVPIAAMAAAVINVPIVCFGGDDAAQFIKNEDYKIAGRGLSTKDAITQVLTKDNGDFTVVLIMTSGRLCFLSGGTDWDNETVLKGKKS